MSSSSNPDASPSDLTSDLNKLFENMLGRIDAVSRSLANLKTLLAAMNSNSQAFDADDKAFVTAKIHQKETELATMQAELNRRQSVYVTSVRRMEQALATRAKILEDVDTETHVLDENPDLLHMLTEKQAKLLTLLEDLRTGLSAPLETPLEDGIPQGTDLQAEEDAAQG